MISVISLSSFFFFFNDTATTEIYTLSLHDALPISLPSPSRPVPRPGGTSLDQAEGRSEEHTSELQSRPHLVCRLLLEKKNKHKAPDSRQKNNRKKQLENNTQNHL